MKAVLLTGAGGDVGRRIIPLLKPIYPGLVLSDMTPVKDTHGLQVRQAALGDFGAVKAAVAGIEGIIHLGGYSVEGPWETILDANIVGCYHLFEAARMAGAKRIVFASSNHAAGFYPRTTTLDASAAPLPDSRYGVSKAFGEALGALYAMKHGIGVTALRIGNVGEVPLDVRRLSLMLHPEDLVQLIRIGLEHPDIVHEVFYGISGNTRAWYDNARARQFGYRPVHDSERQVAHAEAEQRSLPVDPVADNYQGGAFCSIEHSADDTSIRDALQRTGRR